MHCISVIHLHLTVSDISGPGVWLLDSSHIPVFASIPGSTTPVDHPAASQFEFLAPACRSQMFINTSCTTALSHSGFPPRKPTLLIKWSPSRCPFHFAVHFWCTRQHFDDTQFRFVVLQWLPILPAATRQSCIFYSFKRKKRKHMAWLD